MAKSSNTFTGSAVLRIVTALASLIRLRHLRDRGQHDRRGGDREIEPVMLAHGKNVETGLVGEPGGGEDLPEALLGADALSVGPMRRQLAERIKSNFHQA